MEGNDVPLARDLASDCDITISVTCHIYSNPNDMISVTCHISSSTNDTRLILVKILPDLRLRNWKMKKLLTYNSHLT